jgi:hypothetical protein
MENDLRLSFFVDSISSLSRIDSNILSDDIKDSEKEINNFLDSEG